MEEETPKEITAVERPRRPITQEMKDRVKLRAEKVLLYLDHQDGCSILDKKA